MNIAQHTSVFLIRAYKILISPVLAALLGPGAGCRFHPTCSEYAMEAIRLHGFIYGCWLSVRRLARCHPWGACGEDPVPPPHDHHSALPKTCRTH